MTGHSSTDRPDKRSTDSVMPDDAGRMAALGATIREARQGRYSVKELSRIAGVSTGLISQIERGVGNPSMTTLTRLAYALDLSIGSFFEPDGMSNDEGLHVVTADARKRLILPGPSLEYQLLTPNLQGTIGMVKTLIRPRFDNRSEPFRHKGEEVVHLISGSLGVRIAGSECTMHVGDTITYDCGQPHAWFNLHDEPAEVIAAMSPPSF